MAIWGKSISLFILNIIAPLVVRFLMHHLQRRERLYMSDYCVYKHTLPKEFSKKSNDMVYIGITSQKPERRWQNGLGYTYNQYFYRAIKKYGWDNFKHEILFSGLSLNQANKKEIELISFYDSTNRSKGYNLQTGGSERYHYSDEIIEKLKESHAGKNNGMYGKSHTENTRHLMSISKKEYLKSHPHPMKGKHMSNETKAVLSVKAKNRLSDKSKIYNYGKYRKIICVDTGEIFNSINHLSESTGIKISTLYAHLSHQKYKCHGHMYQYLNDTEE